MTKLTKFIKMHIKIDIILIFSALYFILKAYLMIIKHRKRKINKKSIKVIQIK